MLGVRIGADDDGACPHESASGADLALGDAGGPRSVVDPGAGGDRRSRQASHVAHRMKLAVVLVDRGAFVRHDAHVDGLLPKTVGARAHLGPLLVIAGDLFRTIPGEVAADPLPCDDRAHELLVVFRKPPNAERAILSVPTARRDEILGNPGQKKSRVPSARRLGDRASLEHDRLHARPREVIRGRDPRDARADDRNVGGRVLCERRVRIGRDLVEPEAHSGTLPEAEARRPNRSSEGGDVP